MSVHGEGLLLEQDCNSEVLLEPFTVFHLGNSGCLISKERGGEKSIWRTDYFSSECWCAYAVMVPRQEATLKMQPVMSMKNMPKFHSVPTHEFIHKVKSLLF